MAVEAAAITAAEDNGNIRAQYCRCSRGLPRTDRTAAVLHHHVLADQNIVGKMGNMLERWVSMLSRWYKVHRGRGYTSPVRAGCWGALRDDGGQCAQSKSIAVKSSSPAVRGRPQLHMCIIIYVCRCRSRRRLLLLLLLPLFFFFFFFLHTGRLASPGRRQAAHDGGGQRGRVRELQGRSRGQALRQEGRQHAHRPPSHFGDDAKGAQGFRKEAFSVHSYSSTYPVSTILCFENDRPVTKRVDVFGAPRTVTDDHV